MIQGTTKNSRSAGREIPAAKTGTSNIPYSNLLNLTPPQDAIAAESNRTCHRSGMSIRHDIRVKIHLYDAIMCLQPIHKRKDKRHEMPHVCHLSDTILN